MHFYRSMLIFAGGTGVRQIKATFWFSILRKFMKNQLLPKSINFHCRDGWLKSFLSDFIVYAIPPYLPLNFDVDKSSPRTPLKILSPELSTTLVLKMRKRPGEFWGGFGGKSILKSSESLVKIQKKQYVALICRTPAWGCLLIFSYKNLMKNIFFWGR